MTNPEQDVTKMNSGSGAKNRMSNPPKTEKEKMVRMRANMSLRFTLNGDSHEHQKGSEFIVPESLGKMLAKPYKTSFPRGELYDAEPRLEQKATILGEVKE